MRAVIQRATSGEVRVDGRVVGRLVFGSSMVGETRQGLVVLLGVQPSCASSTTSVPRSMWVPRFS